MLTGNIAIYHDDEFKGSNSDVEVGVEVKRLLEDKDGFCYREVEAVEEMVCVLVQGSYHMLSAAFLSLGTWLSEHEQYEMAGYSREVAVRGPWNESDEANYVTEVQIPVKRRNE